MSRSSTSRNSTRVIDGDGVTVGFLSHYHSFTPSFGPTYDSTMSSGGWNYDDSVDTIYAAASSRAWIESGWNSNYASTSTIKVESTEAMLEIEAQERALRAARVLVGDGIPDSAIDPELLGAIERTQSESQTATTKLQENGQLLQALARRQEARLRRNERTVTDPEEHALGEFDDLSRITESSSLRSPWDMQPPAFLPICLNSPQRSARGRFFLVDYTRISLSQLNSPRHSSRRLGQYTEGLWTRRGPRQWLRITQPAPGMSRLSRNVARFPPLPPPPPRIGTCLPARHRTGVRCPSR